MRCAYQFQLLWGAPFYSDDRAAGQHIGSLVSVQCLQAAETAETRPSKDEVETEPSVELESKILQVGF